MRSPPKITEEQAKELIFRRIVHGVTYKALAQEFGISGHYASKICSGDNWPKLQDDQALWQRISDAQRERRAR